MTDSRNMTRNERTGHMGYPEQYGDTELNPPPGDGLDMDCRAGSHRACVGPPGTRCACSCHARCPEAS